MLHATTTTTAIPRPSSVECGFTFTMSLPVFLGSLPLFFLLLPSFSRLASLIRPSAGPRGGHSAPGGSWPEPEPHLSTVAPYLFLRRFFRLLAQLRVVLCFVGAVVSLVGSSSNGRTLFVRAQQQDVGAAADNTTTGGRTNETISLTDLRIIYEPPGAFNRDEDWMKASERNEGTVQPMATLKDFRGAYSIYLSIHVVWLGRIRSCSLC